MKAGARDLKVAGATPRMGLVGELCVWERFSRTDAVRAVFALKKAVAKRSEQTRE